MVDMLLSSCRWIDCWSPPSDWDVSQLEPLEHAAQWRASATCARVSTAWRACVSVWRSLLRKIDLALIRCAHSSIETDCFAVRTVASHCPMLTSLDLAATKCSDNMLTEISTRCPLLRKIVIRSGCVGDTGMGALANLHALQSLDIVNLPLAEISTKAQIRLAGALSLTRLNLTGSAWLNDDGVSALAKCTSLEALFLSTCSGVRDHGLCTIAEACHKLRVVDLSNCARVTDAATCALAMSCPIEHLELANCPAATDGMLAALATARGRLRHLGLGSRSARQRATISEAGLVAFAPACNALRQLCLAACGPAATDTALGALAPHLVKLQVLDLSMCDECTEVGLRELIASCSQLERLNLDGCDALTPALVCAISTSLKQLKWLGTDQPSFHTLQHRHEHVIAALHGDEQIMAARGLRDQLPDCLVSAG